MVLFDVKIGLFKTYKNIKGLISGIESRTNHMGIMLISSSEERYFINFNKVKIVTCSKDYFYGLNQSVKNLVESKIMNKCKYDIKLDNKCLKNIILHGEAFDGIEDIWIAISETLEIYYFSPKSFKTMEVSSGFFKSTAEDVKKEISGSL